MAARSTKAATPVKSWSTTRPEKFKFDLSYNLNSEIIDQSCNSGEVLKYTQPKIIKFDLSYNLKSEIIDQRCNSIKVLKHNKT